MIATSEAFYKSLNIPYRVVAIVSGALSTSSPVPGFVIHKS
jgi:seryl-tRNA synthetase